MGVVGGTGRGNYGQYVKINEKINKKEKKTVLPYSSMLIFTKI